MNDTNWKFPTTSSAVEVQATTASSFNGGGLANALDNSNATSLKSVTRCPKHNLPQDIPPPPSLTKGTSKVLANIGGIDISDTFIDKNSYQKYPI